MGKVACKANLVVTVEGRYYIVDDETGDVKRVIIQDDPNVSMEDMKKIVKFFATKDKEKGE